MSKNTTQPRLAWSVIEVPFWPQPQYEVSEKRQDPGQLPEGKRIIARFEARADAELFLTLKAPA